MIDICFSNNKVECMNASEPVDVEISQHFALVQDSIIPTGDTVVLCLKKKTKETQTEKLKTLR